MKMIGDEKKFRGLKYRCIMHRSTKERAELVKKRLTRIGTISIRISKKTYAAVGVPPVYEIWARPDKQLTWDRLDAAIMRLL